MADLQGPKIRIGKFAEGKVALVGRPGVRPRCRMRARRRDARGPRLQGAPQDVAPRRGAAAQRRPDQARRRARRRSAHRHQVVLGGMLSNNKGINRMGGGLTAPALTAKDMDDVKTAAMLEADYLAVSFPKNKEDMYMARQLLRAAGGRAADRQDRARRGHPRAGGDHRRVRRHHGRARRSRRGSRQRGGTGAAEADDPRGARAQQADDHRNADDGVDDPRAGAHARGSFGRRQCRARRHRRRHAFRRDRRRPISGRDGRDHGADLRRSREVRRQWSSIAIS